MELRFVSKPMKLGSVSLENRFVMPPMVTNYATPEGMVTDRQMAYYAARAEGGVGLIIVECAAVSRDGNVSGRGLCLYDDSFIPALTKLTQKVHTYGTKILVQLGHAGRRPSSSAADTQKLSPSSPPASVTGEVPGGLTKSEIKLIERRFLEAAGRALQAGFDGVELHGAHGYLIHKFLSPGTNKRSDEYGGDSHGRNRFLMEILEGVKETLPSDFVVGCRLNGEDFVKEGVHIEDAKETAVLLASRGVSYVHVSCGVYESEHMTIAPMDVESGYLTPLAAAIKKKVSVPVIAVGRLTDPADADAVIKEGKADLVAMGRALWADPDLPRKALEGRFEEIRPCIGCNQGCRRSSDRCCTMNPETHREMELPLSPAQPAKRILVVGGGPAGLECARVAKMRGHEVILFEKSSSLGGNFHLAAIPPKRADIRKGIRFFENEIHRLNIQVRLGEEATLESIEHCNPDEIILATGAVPIRPAIQGAKQDDLVSAEEALLGKKALGKRVLIIGGGLVGSEVADFLSEKGKEVILVEMLSEINLGRDRPSTFFIRERLQQREVRILLSSKVIRVSGDEVIVEEAGREKHIRPVDSIVYAMGYESHTDLMDKLRLSSFRVHVVGDALKPRDALSAILEGAKIAREI